MDSDASSMSRINRTLVSVDSIDHFVDVSQRVLPCVVSYHCPLLAKAGGISRGYCAFKFENMRLKADGFVESSAVVEWLSFHRLSKFHSCSEFKGT